MPTHEQLGRFQEVHDAEVDPHLGHIIQLHGPFDSEEARKNESVTVVKCIACYVAWPCSTFRIFEDRYKAIMDRLKALKKL